MTTRRHRLRDKICCSAVNLSPVCEQKNLIPETNSRHGGGSAGQPAALDITITSPLQISVQFFPMAFESFGRLYELARKTLKRIALLNENRSLNSAGLSVAFSRLDQSVAVVLMQENAIMLIAKNCISVSH